MKESERIERFWKRVDKSRGCWIWTGGRNDNGYGMAWKDGRHHNAHRLSWEIVNGPIPDGLFVCHNCPGGDNRLCVNPGHMFLGTHTDNMDDMSQKGTQKGPVGSNHHNAKLTEKDVTAIRFAKLISGCQNKALAVAMSVSQATISEVLSRKLWKAAA